MLHARINLSRHSQQLLHGSNGQERTNVHQISWFGSRNKGRDLPRTQVVEMKNWSDIETYRTVCAM
jgi:hypothetical protein